MSSIEITRHTAPVKIKTYGRRDAGEPLKISGVAAPFGTRSTGLGRLIEVLDPGCFSRSLQSHDQVLLWSHNADSPLARKSAGSLTLRETSRGLEFDATLPNTTAARDAYELAQTGIVTQCSFGFIPGAYEWRTAPDGVEELHQVDVDELLEISLVAFPAYGAGTSAEARSTLADRIERVTGTRPRLTLTDRSAYGLASRHSWFLDKAVASRDDAIERMGRLDGKFPAGRLDSTTQPATVLDHITPEAARERLATVEQRAGLSDVAGAGGEFIPAGVPSYVADAFAVSAKNASVILGLFTRAGSIDSATRDRGASTTIAKITGSTVAVQDPAGTGISNTDPTTSLLTSLVSTIAGRILVDNQLFDMGLPQADVVCATELGAQWAALADNELLNGTNANHRTQGLLTQSGITALTYTDASPTPAKVMAQIGELAARVAAARGTLPDVVLMNARRWYSLALDNTSQRSIMGEPIDEPDVTLAQGQVGRLASGLKAYATPAITATFGGGTEDRILVLCSSDLRVFYNRPILSVADQTSITTLQIQAVARAYLSAHPGRYPGGVGVISGTGMIPAAAIS